MTDNSALFTALAKFQASMTNIPKDKTANTGTFGYRYADIAGVIEGIRDPLAAQGLCYTQMLTNIDGTPALMTSLAHESGESIGATVPLMGDLSDPQKFGGIVTYYRRYALLGILGLATDDDDAQHASQSAPVRQHAAQSMPPNKPPQLHTITTGGASQRVDEDMDWTQLYSLTRPMGYGTRPAIEAHIGQSIEGMTPQQVFDAIKNNAVTPTPAQQGFKPQYPASEKQITYITALLRKKGMDARAWPGWAAYALDLDEAPAVDDLDKNQASLIIEKLNDTPDNPQMQAAIEASGGMMAHGR